MLNRSNWIVCCFDMALEGDMSEHTIDTLVNEFKSVNYELIKHIDHQEQFDIDSWMSKRSSVATKIFDHLQEKASFNIDEAKRVDKRAL